MHISLGTGLGAGPRRRGPQAPAEGPPRLLRGPGLVGAGRIGAALTADPGVWAGAEELAFAWLRDGAPIPGASEPVYTPAADDDRAALACRVTARNAAGSLAADTPAVAAVFAPPIPLGPIPDLLHTQGTGPHHVDISSFFSGGSLRFEVSGEGMVVDPATGAATISADALLSGTSFLVTATNSGGRAELGLRLKVVPATAPAPSVVSAERSVRTSRARRCTSAPSAASTTARPATA